MPHVDMGGITTGGRGSLSPFWAGLFGILQKPNKRQQDGKRQQATAGTSTKSTGEAVAVLSSLKAVLYVASPSIAF